MTFVLKAGRKFDNHIAPQLCRWTDLGRQAVELGCRLGKGARQPAGADLQFCPRRNSQMQ